MSILLKALGVLFITGILALVIGQKNGEFSFLIVILSVCTVGVYVLLSLKGPIEEIKEQLMGQDIEIGYFKTVLKCIAVAYISETVADTCNDFGQTALAHKAELAGKCIVFILTLPVFCEVINISLSFLKL